MKKLILFAFIFSAFLLNSCSDMGDPVAPGNGESDVISFSTQILPIFNVNCSNCHSSIVQNGGLDLSSYATLTAGTSNHGDNVVVEFKADSSYLIWALEGTNGAVPMPFLLTPLNQSTIDSIRQWIDEGAQDN